MGPGDGTRPTQIRTCRTASDLDDNNGLLTRYLRDGAGGIVARVDDTGDVSWLLADRLGSIRDITDAAGDVVGTITYDGFGNIVAETAPAYTGDYGFTGLYFSGDTGLMHAVWRVYDFATGRWLQEDPIEFDAGDANLSRYVGNNPTNGIDPSGLERTGNRTSSNGMGPNKSITSLFLCKKLRKRKPSPATGVGQAHPCVGVTPPRARTAADRLHYTGEAPAALFPPPGAHTGTTSCQWTPPWRHATL